MKKVSFPCLTCIQNNGKCHRGKAWDKVKFNFHFNGFSDKKINFPPRSHRPFCFYKQRLLGSWRKLMCVCPSVHEEQIARNVQIFTKFHIWGFIESLCTKSDRTTRTLREDLHTFLIMSCPVLRTMTNVSDRSSKKKQNAHFMFNNFFWNSCLLWDNVEDVLYSRTGYR